MKVNLRRIALSDTANIVRWRNSEDVRKNLFTQDDLTEAQHINWFHSKVEPGFCAQYIIEVSDESGIHDIGTTFIKGIDKEKKEGEFGVFIGEASFRGKHLSAEITKEMIQIGFQELNLKRVWLSVFEDNYAAIKAYRKVGFTLVSNRDDVVRGKKVLYMEIDESVFNQYRNN